MSIVANFDINLRGNTQSIDAAADKTANKIAELREKVDKHGSGIGARMADLGGKIKGAFASLPGAGVITAALAPAVYLGSALGRAFLSSVAGIGSATTAMGAFGVTTTIATAGLNLLLAGVAATGAAAIGAGMAWTGMGLASMEGVKDAQKAADRLGMSVEAVQGFAFKAKMDLDDLSGLLLKMERKIGEGGGANSPFAKLGLEAGKLKSAKPEEALNQIADAFNRIDNQADRVALSMEIFGKQGAKALKLLKGGSQGIAESLAEAKALGIVASAAETKQVAEAAGALKLMKQSMTGLGKTAAITIAPFVKMIAGGLTEAMKWVNQYRENIIDFAYGVEFTFKNFSDYVKLYSEKATLWITEFVNATIHFFTDVLPQLFVSFGELISEGITTGFANGFEKAWNKTVADIKASMRRESGEFETALRRRMQEEEDALDARKKRFLEEKKAALNVTNGESSLAGVRKENSAVERGSVEAFKIIAGDQGDKMYKVANEQLTELRRILDEMRKKKPGKGPQLAKAAL